MISVVGGGDESSLQIRSLSVPLPDAVPDAVGGGDGAIFSTVGDGSALQLASRDKPMADAMVALTSLSFMVSS
jgi:hypothetical protein